MLAISQGQAAANMQQTRHARRLYVGGITEVSEHEIREFFNEIIARVRGLATLRAVADGR
jgi:rubrerythrin